MIKDLLFALAWNILIQVDQLLQKLENKLIKQLRDYLVEFQYPQLIDGRSFGSDYAICRSFPVYNLSKNLLGVTLTGYKLNYLNIPLLMSLRSRISTISAAEFPELWVSTPIFERDNSTVKQMQNLLISNWSPKLYVRH